MKTFTFTKSGRTLLLAAVGAVWLLGCGAGASNPGGGSGDNTGGYNTGGNDSGAVGGADDYVTIGGKKWMKKNLDVATADSWCYEDNSYNCGAYGRLYTWETAKTACRSVGGRLPTRADWEELIAAAGGVSVAGSALKSRSGWYDNGNGADTYGFSALPGGYRNSGGASYGVGYYGNWWTAEEYSGSVAYSCGIGYYGDRVVEYYNSKDLDLSARCLLD